MGGAASQVDIGSVRAVAEGDDLGSQSNEEVSGQTVGGAVSGVENNGQAGEHPPREQRGNFREILSFQLARRLQLDRLPRGFACGVFSDRFGFVRKPLLEFEFGFARPLETRSVQQFDAVIRKGIVAGGNRDAHRMSSGLGKTGNRGSWKYAAIDRLAAALFQPLRKPAADFRR